MCICFVDLDVFGYSHYHIHIGKADETTQITYQICENIKGGCLILNYSYQVSLYIIYEGFKILLFKFVSLHQKVS
jgi:hypothetical protein